MGTSPTMRWKQWDLNKYQALTDKILEHKNTRVIFHGSPNEKQMIEEVAKGMKNKPIILAGKTSIKQAASIINESEIMIGNDSGLTKVSIALDIPTITIWGPSDYPRARAWKKGHIDIRKNLSCSPCFKLNGTYWVENCPYNYKCLKDIDIEEVYEKFLLLYKSLNL